MAGKLFGKVCDFIGLQDNSMDEDENVDTEYDDYDDSYDRRYNDRYDDDDYEDEQSSSDGYDDDYDDGYDDGYDDEYYDEPARTKKQKKSPRLRGLGRKQKEAPVRRPEPVHQQQASPSFAPGKMKMVIYQPMSYDDAQLIIDHLRSRKPIVVNLVDLEIDVAQRILDFMSGAVYAVNGNIQRVAKGIFILAPSNVDISGNITDELPGSGGSYYTLGSSRRREY